VLPRPIVRAAFQSVTARFRLLLRVSCPVFKRLVLDPQLASRWFLLLGLPPLFVGCDPQVVIRSVSISAFIRAVCFGGPSTWWFRLPGRSQAGTIYVSRSVPKKNRYDLYRDLNLKLKDLF